MGDGVMRGVGKLKVEGIYDAVDGWYTEYTLHSISINISTCAIICTSIYTLLLPTNEQNPLSTQLYLRTKSTSQFSAIKSNQINSDLLQTIDIHLSDSSPQTTNQTPCPPPHKPAPSSVPPPATSQNRTPSRGIRHRTKRIRWLGACIRRALSDPVFCNFFPMMGMFLGWPLAGAAYFKAVGV
ncbi:hypothetical protein BDV95DRAFT_72624 [Massariosphaeria phaeospora]|uniref:Uncharacterized protein n=1 Tax=Massariosphaeria phaeospora TaxID=100035 RepID=A0A7C8MLU1_9PLEO|nr:hypothetical protein BDV95DRAFT_72624 [Massariosphaeria phaeospora]